MQSIPIGVEDFKKIIDKNFYYVDKTEFIKDVMEEEVVLYTRPRRFGKTLNMSMLYYFFSIKQKENAYLFQNLNIAKELEITKHQNQYPVMLISLKDMKNDTFEKQLEMYSAIIRDILRRNQELFTSEYISKTDQEQLEAYYRGTKSEVDLQLGLKFISECLQLHYQKNVILLIDEYDVPLQSAYLNGYYEQMANFLRAVFSSALKTNDALEKGVLSGCLRIAKESIFTGLNNFNVYSIFDKKSNSCFGFTPQETVQLINDCQLSAYEGVLKQWYDGYLFGDQEIYNPWSVLKYAQKIQQGDYDPESFWANTSGNDLVYRYIQEGTLQMKQEFNVLSTGGTIEKVIKPELTYREMEDTENIYSFLLFTGYLKVVKKTGINMYELAIPNQEILFIYTQIFEEWFSAQVKDSRKSLLEALMKENVNQANTILNQVLFQSISYFDYDEKFYHGFMTGILQGNAMIVSNQESGLGRFDLAVLPAYRKHRGLLFELKVASIEKDMEKAAEHACRQIKEMQYIEGLKELGYTDIIGYGIAFYKKSCVIIRVK